MSYRKLAAVGASAVALAGLPLAHAQAAQTLVVDDNSACAGATFTTIQSAVDAAEPGDTIRVCAGRYEESVTVTKAALNIRGAKAGVDARTRSTLRGESIIDPPDGAAGVLLAANGDTLNGFVVQGATGAPGVQTASTSNGNNVLNNVVRNNTFGLYLNSTGSSQAVVQHNRFSGNNVAGPASGNGIYSDQGARNILIYENRFVNNNNSAALFTSDGAVNSNIVIGRNTATGNSNGAFAIYSGSNLRISYNSITGTATDNGVGGTAVFLGSGSSGVTVLGNVIRQADFSGVAVRGEADNVDILKNDVGGSVGNGIDVSTTSPGAVNAQGNKVHGNAGDGLVFTEETSGNVIRFNTSRNNRGLDCRDLSTGDNTAGTANFWASDTGATAEPRGICTAP